MNTDTTIWMCFVLVIAWLRPIWAVAIREFEPLAAMLITAISAGSMYWLTHRALTFMLPLEIKDFLTVIAWAVLLLSGFILTFTSPREFQE